MKLDLHSRVDDILRRWPVTIRVFLDHGMSCVGCPIAAYHTVEDVCRAYGIDAGKFLTELRIIARRPRRERKAGAGRG